MATDIFDKDLMKFRETRWVKSFAGGGNEQGDDVGNQEDDSPTKTPIAGRLWSLNT